MPCALDDDFDQAKFDAVNRKYGELPVAEALEVIRDTYDKVAIQGALGDAYKSYVVPEEFKGSGSRLPSMGLAHMLPFVHLDRAAIRRNPGVVAAFEASAAKVDAADRPGFAVYFATSLRIAVGPPSRAQADRVGAEMRPLMPAVAKVWRESFQDMPPAIALRVLCRQNSLTRQVAYLPEVDSTARHLLRDIRKVLPPAQQNEVDALRRDIAKAREQSDRAYKALPLYAGS